MEFRKEDVIFKGVLLGGNSGQDASFIWYFKKKRKDYVVFVILLYLFQIPNFALLGML